MKKVITIDHVVWSEDRMYEEWPLLHPIKSWVTDLEDGALAQAKNVANLPFLFKWLALMPDCHQGYGMPIGGVLAAEQVVVPNAVGVDIGCGMVALQLPQSMRISYAEYLDIQREIKHRIPVGYKHQSVAQARMMKADGIELPFIDSGLPVTGFIEEGTIFKQLGTLGGGNHFIELQEDEYGGPWIMIHSGSRNIGLKVAQHYNKMAKILNALWYSSVPAKADLAFLPINTEQAQDYIHEMEWCLAFAKLNRRIMIDIVGEIVQEITGVAIPYVEPIDVHHNYAAMENHYGRNVMVHRKGAISAREGEYVVIPGSQGSPSFIGMGKGNRESFYSCSHGAGRTMGRGEAKKTLDLREQQAIMDEQQIVHGMNSIDSLDEARDAYKDIEEVMKNQTDLVHVTHKLQPRAVVKDTSKKRRRKGNFPFPPSTK